ncbi:class I glutamine amidotransferase-like protein [Pyrenochaeta sp. DS3sAY3a]|nr:class I glutamine amidotransferase-like protein [Pyrenochaeta sp. DS3sAY3a]
MKIAAFITLLTASTVAAGPPWIPRPVEKADDETTSVAPLPEASSLPLPVNGTLPPPKNWAVALFPSFDSIDVVGPLNPLWYLAFSRHLNLYLLSTSLHPVPIAPLTPSLNTHNSSFWWSMTPTHTYAAPPPDIEVLPVPGGAGARAGNVSAQIEFVRHMYPKLRYLISVCTGAGILARAGVLDGRRATTNKKAWGPITAMGPEVQWVSPARWVVDGNIWSSSGVTAGQDLIFAFMEEVYGAEVTRSIQATTEFERSRGMCDDPFAEIHGVEPTWTCVERGSNGSAPAF